MSLINIQVKKSHLSTSRRLLVDGDALIDETDDFIDDALLLVVQGDLFRNRTFGSGGGDGGLRAGRRRFLPLALLQTFAKAQK